MTPKVRDILKILWKRGETAPKEQFLLFSTKFCYLLLDFHVKTGIRFSLRDKRLFEISEIEITRVNCIFSNSMFNPFSPVDQCRCQCKQSIFVCTLFSQGLRCSRTQKQIAKTFSDYVCANTNIHDV